MVKGISSKDKIQGFFSEIDGWNAISGSNVKGKKARWHVQGNSIVVSNLSKCCKSRKDENLGAVFDTMNGVMEKYQLSSLKREARKNPKAFETLEENVNARSQKWIKRQEGRYRISKKICGTNDKVTVVRESSNKLLQFIKDLIHPDRKVGMLTRSRSLLEQKPVESSSVPTLTDVPFQLFSTDIDGDLCPVVLQAIEKAKSEIVIFMSKVSDPRIIEALEKKAKEGVLVTIFHDKDAFNGAPKPIDSKVKCVDYKCPGLMHLKIMAIDDADLLFGSADFTSKSIAKDSNVLTALKCESLVEMIHKKADSDQEQAETSSKPAEHAVRMLLSISEIDGKKKIQFSFNPNHVCMNSSPFNYLKAAEKTLKVAMYAFTDEKLAQALIDKKKAGVDVQVVIDHQQGMGASKKVCTMLDKAGVPVFLSKDDPDKSFNYKLAIIDQKTLLCGSADWTPEAFEKDEEYFAALDGLSESDMKPLDAMWDKIKSNIVSPAKKEETQTSQPSLADIDAFTQAYV